MLRYDMHKELQVVMREQVRHFQLAREDTAQVREKEDANTTSKCLYTYLLQYLTLSSILDTIH